MELKEIALVLGAIAAIIAVIGGAAKLVQWIQRLVADKRPLIVSSYPNHTYTQRDGTIVLGMHLDITNPSRKTRSLNNIQLRAEPPSTIVSLAKVDWTEPLKAELDIDLPQGLYRHSTPAEDVLRFPLRIPGEDRKEGLIFLYLKPSVEVNRVNLTIALLDGSRELGTVVATLDAILVTAPPQT